MSLSRSARLARALVAACLLLPAFLTVQADLLELCGIECCEAEGADDSGHCCTDDHRDDSGSRGCETCPCCPGVAIAIPPRAPASPAGPAPLLADLTELGTRAPWIETDRVFRPPRSDSAA